MCMNKLLENIYEEVKKEKNRGILANYIPELAKANINSLGLVLIDQDKNIYKYGDYQLKFTIQSISKLIALSLALEENTWEQITTKVNFKPTENLFNSYSGLEEENYLPANPMINAGAIATSSLVRGDRLERILDFIARAIGEKVNYNQSVYQSESKTGDRNKAIAYLLKSKHILADDFLQVLEDYFKQCSIEMDLLQLGKFMYMFANGGLSYFGDKLLSSTTVSQVNSLMAMAGMYNYSGEYAMKVGIPSKSGVAGALVGVVPKKAVIACYSPGLDENGNSVLGQVIMEKISKKLEYNIFY